jgi:hypothetical protein
VSFRVTLHRVLHCNKPPLAPYNTNPCHHTTPIHTTPIHVTIQHQSIQHQSMSYWHHTTPIHVLLAPYNTNPCLIGTIQHQSMLTSVSTTRRSHHGIHRSRRARHPPPYRDRAHGLTGRTGGGCISSALTVTLLRTTYAPTSKRLYVQLMHPPQIGCMHPRHCCRRLRGRSRGHR